MVKEIHCFGTSLTAGGGFEWDSPLKMDILHQNYTEEPFTQEYYSYPGQLQRLVGDDIKVFNHGKNGYGNERMYRKSYDIINAAGFNKDEHIFILEFSSMGRKEFWSNTFKKYLIANYHFNQNGTINIHGIADKYYYDNDEILQKLKTIVTDFLTETIRIDVQENLTIQNNDMFLHYLMAKNINFLVIEEPFDYKLRSLVHPYKIKFEKNIYQLTKFISTNKLTITDETDGKIDDFHPGLQGNKLIAEKISNHLKQTHQI